MKRILKLSLVFVLLFTAFAFTGCSKDYSVYLFASEGGYICANDSSEKITLKKTLHYDGSANLKLVAYPDDDCDFTYWLVNTKINSYDAELNLKVKKETVVKAMFSPKGYFTITYLDENGEYISDEKILPNGIVANVPEIPTKEGYVGAFYCGDDKIENGDVYAYGENKVFQLKYTAISSVDPQDEYFTITYLDENGQFIANEKVLANGKVAHVPAIAEREGFVGAFYCGDDKIENGYVYTYGEDKTFQLRYTAISSVDPEEKTYNLNVHVVNANLLTIVSDSTPYYQPADFKASVKEGESYSIRFRVNAPLSNLTDDSYEIMLAVDENVYAANKNVDGSRIYTIDSVNKDMNITIYLTAKLSFNVELGDVNGESVETIFGSKVYTNGYFEDEIKNDDTFPISDKIYLAANGSLEQYSFKNVINDFNARMNSTTHKNARISGAKLVKNGSELADIFTIAYESEDNKVLASLTFNGNIDLEHLNGCSIKFVWEEKEDSEQPEPPVTTQRTVYITNNLPTYLEVLANGTSISNQEIKVDDKTSLRLTFSVKEPLSHYSADAYSIKVRVGTLEYDVTNNEYVIDRVSSDLSVKIKLTAKMTFGFNYGTIAGNDAKTIINGASSEELPESASIKKVMPSIGYTALTSDDIMSYTDSEAEVHKTILNFVKDINTAIGKSDYRFYRISEIRLTNLRKIATINYTSNSSNVISSIRFESNSFNINNLENEKLEFVYEEYQNYQITIKTSVNVIAKVNGIQVDFTEPKTIKVGAGESVRFEIILTDDVVDAGMNFNNGYVIVTNSADYTCTKSEDGNSYILVIDHVNSNINLEFNLVAYMDTNVNFGMVDGEDSPATDNLDDLFVNMNSRVIFTKESAKVSMFKTAQLNENDIVRVGDKDFMNFVTMTIKEFINSVNNNMDGYRVSGIKIGKNGSNANFCTINYANDATKTISSINFDAKSFDMTKATGYSLIFSWEEYGHASVKVQGNRIDLVDYTIKAANGSNQLTCAEESTLTVTPKVAIENAYELEVKVDGKVVNPQSDNGTSYVYKVQFQSNSVVDINVKLFQYIKLNYCEDMSLGFSFEDLMTDQDKTLPYQLKFELMGDFQVNSGRLSGKYSENDKFTYAYNDSNYSNEGDKSFKEFLQSINDIELVVGKEYRIKGVKLNYTLTDGSVPTPASLNVISVNYGSDNFTIESLTFESGALNSTRWNNVELELVWEYVG